MDDKKQCRKCRKYKDARLDFYMCAGVYRTECKVCTIKRNTSYQKKVKSWKYRYRDEEARRQYMQAYREKNPDKIAQYREKFKEKYPDYYREYKQRRREKDDG